MDHTNTLINNKLTVEIVMIPCFNCYFFVLFCFNTFIRLANKLNQLTILKN